MQQSRHSCSAGCIAGSPAGPSVIFVSNIVRFFAIEVCEISATTNVGATFVAAGGYNAIHQRMNSIMLSTRNLTSRHNISACLALKARWVLSIITKWLDKQQTSRQQTRLHVVRLDSFFFLTGLLCWGELVVWSSSYTAAAAADQRWRRRHRRRQNLSRSLLYDSHMAEHILLLEQVTYTATLCSLSRKAMPNEPLKFIAHFAG